MNRIFRMNWLANVDLEGTVRFLERMHADGWHLEKGVISGWWFRRGEPEQMKYCLLCLPEPSAERNMDTEEIQERYGELCEAAGWEVVDHSGLIQVCRTHRDNPIPMETDEELKFRTIHRTARKQLILPMAIILIVLLAVFVLCFSGLGNSGRILVEVIWRPGILGGLFFSLLLLILTVISLVKYLLWYVRSRKALMKGDPVSSRSPMFLCGAGILALMVLLWAGILFFAAQGGDYQAADMLSTLLMYFCIVLIAGIVRQYFLGSGQKSSAIAAAIGVAVLIALGGTFIEPFAKPLLTGGEEMTGQGEPWAHKLPLTLKDLGVGEPEDDPNWYWVDEGHTILGSGGRYMEFSSAGDWNLQYEVNRYCSEELKEFRVSRMAASWAKKGFELTDDPRWQAQQVWASGEDCFILVYPDRMIDLYIAVPELTDERISTAVKQLTT